ncbi:ATP-binding protein [Microbispora rosea]|uniref:ATP-binding protein n=1 Tax=Microbispora rosea TaxID=58117 RepID=UPI00379E7655
MPNHGHFSIDPLRNQVSIMQSPFSPAYGRVSEELSLPAHPAAISRARHFIRSIVTRWQLSDVADDAELLTSEIVTNAVQAIQAAAVSDHRSHLVVVRARLTQKHLYVEVWDSVGTLWPISTPSDGTLPAKEDDIAECGRGLTLVELLSHAWGVIPGRRDGKVVWFSIALPRACQAVPNPLPTATAPVVAITGNATSIVLPHGVRVADGLLAAVPAVIPLRPGALPGPGRTCRS